MTLLTDQISKEYAIAANQTSFVISGTPAFISRDVDESLKVFIREDARVFTPTSVDVNQDFLILPSHAYSISLATIVVFSTDNIAPSPLQSGEQYYVKYIDPDNIQLSLTAGGPALDLTTTGTGNHTLRPLDPNGIQLALNVDYYVTKDSLGAPIGIDFLNRVGVVNQILFVLRQSSLLQEDVVYPAGTPWQPVEYETHVDKIYAVLQEQGEKLSRAMVTRIGDTSTSNLVFPVPADNNAIGWYALGTSTFGMRNYDLSLFATVAQLNALAQLQGDTVDLRGSVLIPNPFVDDVIVPTFSGITVADTAVDVLTDIIDNGAVHGFSTGDEVNYTFDANTIGGLISGQNYYIINDSETGLNTFKLAISLADANAHITIQPDVPNNQINLTVAGTGNHTFTRTFTDIFTMAATTSLTLDLPIKFYLSDATGTAPSPLVDNTVYYIQEIVDGTTFKLSATVGGGAIILTDAGDVGTGDFLTRRFNVTGVVTSGISVSKDVATGVTIEFQGYRKIDTTIERYMGTLKYVYDDLVGTWVKVADKYDIAEGSPTIVFLGTAGETLVINIQAMGIFGVTYDDTSFVKYIAHYMKV